MTADDLFLIAIGWVLHSIWGIFRGMHSDRQMTNAIVHVAETRTKAGRRRPPTTGGTT